MITKKLFITQNSYYFVHRHFINFFESEDAEVIFVTEDSRGIKKKYFEFISYFGIHNFIKSVFFEIVFMLALRKRKNKLKVYSVKDKDVNKFLKNIIKNNEYKLIFSIGCPCLISSQLQSKEIPIYNLHGGIIPFQKGRFSPLKAIKKCHKYLGCSIHLINHNFDDGLVISQDYFELKNNYKLLNYQEVLKLSSALLGKFLLGQYKILPKKIFFEFQEDLLNKNQQSLKTKFF